MKVTQVCINVHSSVNEVDDSHVTSAANSSDASKGRHKLQEWLNKNMRIKLTDGRTLIGDIIYSNEMKLIGE